MSKGKENLDNYSDTSNQLKPN